MSSGKVLLGVLAGIAAGATLGILFAPDNGASTRKKISQKSNEYADGLGEKFNNFIDSITNQFETVREEAACLVGNGVAKAKEAVADARGFDASIKG